MSIADNTTTAAGSIETDTEDTADEARVYHWFDGRDYEKVGDGTDFCYLHQLLACVDHSPYEVFNERRHTHHETGFKADNRPESLSVRTITEHQRLHNGEWDTDSDEPRLVRQETSFSEFGIGSD